MAQLILFNKPFDVLSQFTDTEGRATLAQYLSLPGVRPVGRLDRDSEGLLLLTDNGSLQHRISDPRHKLPKTYLVQVEGVISEAALQQLRHGIVLNDGPTRPALVRAIDPPTLWERDPPIRTRMNVPDSWLELAITEGRNRQVRRMTAAVGFPTLRLVRWRIGGWCVDGLAPGEHKILEVADPTISKQDKPAPRGGRPLLHLNRRS
jgi:23S rRNA pseudouridine2457 synthase